MKSKYYSLKKILDTGSQYNVIIGERSNGKTYAVLYYMLEKWVKNGEQSAYLRRFEEDYKGKRGQQLYANHVNNNVVEKLTGGEWTGIYYYASKWFLCRYEDDKRIVQEDPFCYAFSIAGMEHDKSSAYPKITTICYDEFLTRSFYIPDEFVIYMNVVSTIVRHRTNVKIFMLGNTVNKYCPYFAEMGLTHVKNMNQGTIDIYQYGSSALKVAVEYCETNSKNSKTNDLYFAFDNPKLSMITGGQWEIDIYPHCPCKYQPKDILFTYFIEFAETILQCEIIEHSGLMFTYIHAKTSPLKNPDNDLIYSTNYDVRGNWRRNILKPVSKVERKITDYFLRDKVFYQDNEVGEVVRNYLMWCKKN